jgi:hypothetical protein
LTGLPTVAAALDLPADSRRRLGFAMEHGGGFGIDDPSVLR